MDFSYTGISTVHYTAKVAAGRQDEKGLTYRHKIITLFIIHERLPHLGCGTSSGTRNLILSHQAINPESVLREGNSLGPVPRGQGEGKEQGSANWMLPETKDSRPLFLPGGSLEVIYNGKNVTWNTAFIKPRRIQPKALKYLFLVFPWGQPRGSLP